MLFSFLLFLHYKLLWLFFFKYVSKKVTFNSTNKFLKLWSMLFNGREVLMGKFQSTNTPNILEIEVINFTFICLTVFTEDQGNLWFYIHFLPP